MSNWAIGKRMAVVFAILLGVFAIFGTWIFIQLGGVANNLKTISEESVIFALHAKNLEKEVIEVQQYLQDISATRGQDGLDDGFSKAEKSSQSFMETLAKFEQMFTRENDQAALKQLSELRGLFNSYYASGVEMAKAYVKGGPSAGNKHMSDFDGASETLQKKLEPFISSQVDEAITLSKESTDKANSIQKAEFIVFVMIFALIIAMGILLSRSITSPLAQIQAVMAKVVASNDFSQRANISTRDEVGLTAQAFNTLLETQQKAISEVNGVVGAIANGDFSRRVDADLKGDLKTMKDAVNASAQSVKVTMDALNGIMQSLQAGDFSQRMSAEVKGEFKLAVDQAMQAMQAMLGNVGAVMSKVADGDLTQRVTADGRGDLATLKENINTSLAAMSKALGAVSSNTQQVAAASNQTSSAIGQISDGAQNQMHAINQVATAVQQTAASVTDVAKAAESANSRAQSMGLTVNESMADMNRMVDIVQTIAANADRIDKITDVIEKIANKTNLLSLNAAIEAARAGEHGKGFAVVAEEVGKLAASAAESTQEITALVKQAVEDADRASETVTVVNKGMQGIAHGARQTEAELQRISAAMEQQNAAITEINANVGSLNKIASANASAAEEITATVIELARLADGTRKEVARFAT